MRDPLFNTLEDMKLHISALKYIARADGHFTNDEKHFIESTVDTYCLIYPNISAAELLSSELSDGEYRAVLEKIAQNHVCARLLIKDLIMLGHVDGCYTEDEMESVAKIANLLGLSSSLVHELEETTAELQALILKINRIIHEPLLREISI